MHFTDQKIERRLDEIKSYIYRDSEEITDYRILECDDAHSVSAEAVSFDDSDWRMFDTASHFGGYDKYVWFRRNITIPERFAGKRVAFYVFTETDVIWKKAVEYLVYVDGKARQGLDIFHHELLLTDCANGGESFFIAMKAFSGLTHDKPRTTTKLVVIDEVCEDFYFNVKIAFEHATSLDDNKPEYHTIFNALNKAINMLDLRTGKSDAFYESVRTANTYLLDNLYTIGSTSPVTVKAVGHTHIDVAWLWQLKHTREKCSRSFSTVLNLMDQYPSYKFIQSQPQLYDYIKNDYPDIFSRIKEKIAEGRWEPEGGMWVEADCNVISGESMVRQFLYGKRFFMQEFGKNSEILWLPDVFGYSASMPQILRKCGVKYFMTTKISWNQFNDVPMDTFHLVGIDGSSVLTHFITTPEMRAANIKRGLPYKKSYNGVMMPKTINRCWDVYKNKDINNELLVCYGWGDGGGGPTKEMLENAVRMNDLIGCHHVEMGFAGEFFDKLSETVSDADNIQSWHGELYLELHRGTYTSMARNKRYNRISEFLFLATETFAAFNMLLGGDYPQKKLNECWKIILLNQFHDIIPGSSIKEVYDDSLVQYEDVIKSGRDLLCEALNGIAANIALPEKSVVVFNQTSFNMSDFIYFDLNGQKPFGLKDGDKQLPQQLIGGKMAFFCGDVPPKGYRAYGVCSASSELSNGINVSSDLIETPFFKIELDKDGYFTSVFDKQSNREVLAEGSRGNVFEYFEDKPINYSAWDIDVFYEEKRYEVNDIINVEVVERGPLIGILRIKRRLMDSVINQDIVVYRDIPRIDFRTTVDWKQHETLLKVAFPVDVNSLRATYEIQYGNIERNTHRNTSWDYAKFEVVGHKWADLSEGNYGISLLNDCKYGYDIHDNVMRLTLIKSGINPNPVADNEMHEFVYSLYPHSGALNQADTIKAAYSLNCPLIYTSCEPHNGALAPAASLVEVDKDNVIVECIKRAEDSDDLIIRLYEAKNMKTPTRIKLNFDFIGISLCDMLENEIAPVQTDAGSCFGFTIKPFEILTYKIKLKR